MWLLVVAAFGFLVPNGFFVHWLLTGDKSVAAVLGNELALGFILDCALAMVLLAWLFAVRPIGRVRWPWFVVLSFAGGLGFSIPFYLWLNRRSSGDPKASFGAWWRGAGVVLLVAAGVAAAAGPAARAAELRRFTLDDEMALRTINDVEISPDGAWVAYTVSTPSLEKNEHQVVLYVVAADGGEPRRLGESVRILSTPLPAPLGRQMFEQPIVRVPIAGGRPEQLTTGVTVNYALSLSRDGKRLAYRSVEGRTMGDVFVMTTATGKTARLTEVNPQLRELALGKLEAVSWRSFDGMEIWGLLLTPPGSQPEAGKRLPMLVYIHGGPGGGVTHGLFPQFMHTVGQVDPFPTEAFAGTGYAVLFPMPRGGAGYGEAGQRMIVDRWGEDDYRDIMAGVDAMIDLGVADADRLGVMGASYGGYMTNWIVTQTGRFKAAAAAASICDLEDARLLPDGGEFMANYFREPWENRASYAAHSPINFVQKVTTPLLLQHGERDPRVPVAGAWKMYRALKSLGRPVELHLYPRGGHLMYEPLLQRELMRKNKEWLER